MKKNMLSAAALVVLFAACSKDDNNTPPAQTPSKYILNILSDGDSLEVTYDAAFNMKKVSSWYTEENEIDASELVYENGKLTKLLFSENSGENKVAQTFEYNNAGQLIKANFFSHTSGQQGGFDSVVYNTEGRPVTVYIAVGTNNVFKPIYKDQYIWDNKGNIVKSIHLEIYDGVEAKDSSITIYTYDDKVNFYAKQAEFFITDPVDPITGLSVNNVTRSVETDNTRPGHTVTSTNEYTYDTDGYPVTKTETYVSKQGEQVEHMENQSYKYRYIKK